MIDKPQVGIAVILMSKDDKFLFGKRKVQPGKGLYAAPGGHLEYKETMKECGIREIEEETGISSDLLSKYDFEFADISEEVYDDSHYITSYLFVELDETSDQLNIKNMEPHKCEGWKWFDLEWIDDNAKEADFFGKVIEIIRGPKEWTILK